MDLESAQTFIRNNPDCCLVIPDEIRFSLEEQYKGDRVAAKKGETELMYFVNGVINEVIDGGLYDQWVETARKRAAELDL